MSATDLAVVNQQIKQFWGPLGGQELREKLLLGGLVSKKYEGELKEEGDTVYVSELADAQGEMRTIGVNADEFETESMSLTRVSVQANKRAVAGFKIANLTQLQSQLKSADSPIRQSLLRGVQVQINDFLYALMAPSASAPDHKLNSIATMDAAQLLAIRLLAAQAKWPDDGNWWGLLDPAYYNHVLAATTMTSKDYVEGEAPVIAGKIANKRFGFNLLEDNSRSAGAAFFHPSFLNFVVQQEVNFKVSDLHSNNEFAYNVTADVVLGAALGINGSKKHIVCTTAATGNFPPKAS